MLRKLIHSLYITLFLITLSACGFHLRGTAELAPSLKNIHITANEVGAREILPKIISQLKNSGFNVIDNAELTLVLKLFKQTEDNITSSTSYEFTDHLQTSVLTWTLLTPTKAPLFVDKKIIKTRYYTVSENNQTAAKQEALDNWRSLQKSIAMTLPRQLSTFSEAQIKELITQAEAAQNAQKQQEKIIKESSKDSFIEQQSDAIQP